MSDWLSGCCGPRVHRHRRGTLAIRIGVKRRRLQRGQPVCCSKASPTKAAPGVGRVATTPGGQEIGYGCSRKHRRFADAVRGALDVAAEWPRPSMAWRHDGATETAWVLFVTLNDLSMVTADTIVGQLRVEPHPVRPHPSSSASGSGERSSRPFLWPD